MLLINLNSSHPVFAKDYVAPKEPRDCAALLSSVPNTNGFFDNIPYASVRSKGRPLIVADKQYKDTVRLQKLKVKAEKANAVLLKQQQK